MDQVNALSVFFNAIAGDARISITHIGVYAALLEQWRRQCFENPVIAFSHEIMLLAKISTKTTYCRIVRELSDYGYIRYESSLKRNKGSRIFIVR